MWDSNSTGRGGRSLLTRSDRRATVRRVVGSVAGRLRGVAGRAVQFSAVTVGVVSLALAVAITTGVGGDPLSRLPGSGLLGEGTVGLLGIAAGLVVLWALAELRSSTSSATGLPDSRASGDSDRRVAGADFDSKVNRHANATSLEVSWYDRDVRHRLEELAVSVLREHTDADEESAAAALADGTWTDDPRASAYFADDARLPLRLRLLDWASGSRYKRQVEAVTDELAGLAGVDTGAASSRAVESVQLDADPTETTDWDEYETSWAEVINADSGVELDAAVERSPDAERDVEVERDAAVERNAEVEGS